MNDEQQRTWIETELSQNMLVEASAGSGKTEALARRMACGLKWGVYEVEHLAAVTFTKQAASELRGRLQLKLEAALRDLSKEEEALRCNVERALSRLEHLFAGTIHAFCARLLRERPVEAGLTPGFRELEHGESKLAVASLHATIDRLRIEAPEQVEILRQLAIGAHELEETFLKVCQYSDVDLPCEDLPAPELPPVHAAIAEFRALLGTICPDFPPNPRCAVQRQLIAFRGHTNVPATNLGKLAVALGELEKESVPTFSWWGRGSEARAAAETARTALSQFRSRVVLPFLEQVRSYAYAPLIRLLASAREAFEQERMSTGTLSFSDLLRIAAWLLSERPAVRAALSQKYRYILVDEFQDTDPLQAEVLMWLASEPGQSGPWDKLKLRPGALFVVGDPKQSIYRFRRADISVYHAVRDQIADGGTHGRVVSLTHSFRSRPEVCNWVNEVFRALFPAELSEVQAPFAELESEAEPTSMKGGPSPNPDFGVKLLSVPVEGAWAEKVAQADSRAIASWIAAEIRNGSRKPGDFMILTRNKSRIPLYVAALGHQAIPVESVYAGVAGQSGVTRAVLEVLRAISNPEDSIAVVAALRGPLFGRTDEELHQHVLAAGTFQPASVATSGHPEVVSALARMHRMVLWTRQRTPAAAVERILEETGALAWAVAESVGGTEAGALLDLTDRVRQAVERGGGLSEAVEEMEAELDGSQRDRPAWPLEPGRRDVVRVMNLHVSKGLEASVVILADPAGGKTFAPDMRVVRQGASALRGRGDQPVNGSSAGRASAVGYMQVSVSRNWARRVIAQPPDWALHEAEEQRFQEAEQDRLLYVATTRARELLVISRVEDVDGSARPQHLAWGRLGRFTRGLPELRWDEVEPPTQSTRIEGDEVEAAELRADRWAAVHKPGWTRRSVTASADEGPPSRGAAGVLRFVEGWKGKSDGHGAAWGSLIHRLMEQAVRPPTKFHGDLYRLARWYSLDTPELADRLSEAVQVVLDFLATDYGKHVLAAERLAEVPFAVSRPHGVLLFGVLDLAVKTPAGWELIDYKTDSRAVEHLVELYGDQIGEYARAWTTATGEVVSYRGLYGVVSGELSDDLSPDSRTRI